MLLEDFDAEEFVESQFDALYDYLQALVDFDGVIQFRFSGCMMLGAELKMTIGEDGLRSYELIVTRRMVELLYRYFFAMAATADCVNGVELENSQPSPLARVVGYDYNSLEALLNEMPLDTFPDDDRVGVMLFFLETAWHIILYHEFVHIVRGHIRFKTENRLKFDADYSYSRACELEADHHAARWLTQRKRPFDPHQLFPYHDIRGAGTSAAEYAALIASCMFFCLSIRISHEFQHSKEGTHPHIDLRRFAFLSEIVSSAQWNNKDDEYRSLVNALTEATRLTCLLSLWPKPKKPTMILEMPLEDMAVAHAKYLKEFDEKHTEWENFRMHWKKSLPSS